MVYLLINNNIYVMVVKHAYIYRRLVQETCKDHLIFVFFLLFSLIQHHIFTLTLQTSILNIVSTPFHIIIWFF